MLIKKNNIMNIKNSPIYSGSNLSYKNVASSGNCLFANNIDEAINISHSLGIKKVDYSDGNLYLVNLINSTMNDYKILGFPMPEEIILKPFKERSFIIPYGEFIPPSSLVFYTKKDWSPSSICERYKAGQFSTPVQSHPIDHEMCHFLHYSADHNGNFDRLRRQEILDLKLKVNIEENISKYGASNYLDFIAETSAKIKNIVLKKSYSEIPEYILMKYKRLGGSEILLNLLKKI